MFMNKEIENRISNIITEEIKKSEALDYIKKDKDFEKRVKDIVIGVVIDLFRTLWQHNSLYKNMLK